VHLQELLAQQLKNSKFEKFAKEKMHLLLELTDVSF